VIGGGPRVALVSLQGLGENARFIASVCHSDMEPIVHP